jgi:monoamine oxidase
VCTIPPSILSQIEVQAGSTMQNAIAAVPYGSSMKIGLEFKRRFWEEDERIYGGISYTDLPIQQISYPSTGYMGAAPPCCWAPMHSRTPTATASPRSSRERSPGAGVRRADPSSTSRSSSTASPSPGIACPGSTAASATGPTPARAALQGLAQIDGRLVLAGEHVSYIPAWQEGAVLSSLDAIQRLHAKASSL